MLQTLHRGEDSGVPRRFVPLPLVPRANLDAGNVEFRAQQLLPFRRGLQLQGFPKHVGQLGTVFPGELHRLADVKPAVDNVFGLERRLVYEPCLQDFVIDPEAFQQTLGQPPIRGADTHDEASIFGFERSS